MVRIAQASIDENNNIMGGSKGNQTGGELNIHEWYRYGWTILIRPTHSVDAELIAKSAETLAKNKCIGYDQANRTSLFIELLKIKYNYNELNTPCETDCSAFVACCLIIAGFKVSQYATTSTLVAECKKSNGFTYITQEKFLDGTDYLQRGDILLKAGHHVVICLDNGFKVVNEKAKTPEKVNNEVVLKTKNSKPTNTKTYHYMTNGETLYSLADLYHTTVAKIMSINEIKDVKKIQVGTKIRIK